MTPAYACLIMDHDDTVVNSTATIHYPAHLEVMRRLRPVKKALSLDEWFTWNFHPGIMAYLTEELEMNDREVAEEIRIWRTYTSTRVPEFYPGMAELLRDFSAAGGLVTVVSLSEEQTVRAHYQANETAPLPKAVYGWDMDENKRKPNPWPVKQILSRFNLHPEQVLLVDDLKPGIDMAKQCGVPAAAAGWGHAIAEIRHDISELADHYLPTVDSLRELVFI